MTTRSLAIGLACLTPLTLGAASAAAATRCVGSAPGCQRTLQAALDASHDGDTIKVGPGTFAGGVRIADSVRLTGAGAHATTIRGGGPVVTVGTLGDESPPTVTIADVTITGGRTRSGPQGEPFVALGGGVFVPPGAGGLGATLTIRDSVISGNRAAPAESVVPDDDGPRCPGGRCPYAEGDGGGIASFGTLKLADSVVSDNEAGGPVASDAKGAGVYSAVGSLTVDGAKLVRNRVFVAAPNGRFAEGGGLLVENDAAGAAIRDTLIGDNRADLTSDLPPFAGDELIDVQVHAAGVLIANHVPTTIDRTVIAGNAVMGRNPAGEPLAYDSALQVLDTPATVRNTLIAGNRVTSDTLTTADVGPVGGAVEFDGGGTLSNVHIVGNSSVVRSPDGDALVAGSLGVFDFENSPDLLRLIDSTIAGNDAVARSDTGSATVMGGGVFNNSLLDLRRTVVSHNSGRASAPGGAAQGGGIWNGVFLSGPPVELSLTDSLITGNALLGGSGIERQGGGLYTTEPVTRTRTPIFGNTPDQVFGPDAAARIAGRSASALRRSRRSQ